MTAASGTCPSIRIHMTANAMRHRQPDMLIGPAGQPGEFDQTESDERERRNRGQEHDHRDKGRGFRALRRESRRQRPTHRIVATTACTDVPMPRRNATAYMKGAIGQPRMRVVRPCAYRLPAKTAIRHVRIRKKISSSKPPRASNHAAARLVRKRARISTFRFTQPASPAGMQAETATANTIAVISLSAVIAVLASHLIRTSMTVTPAAINIPSTPMNAIGRVRMTQIVLEPVCW